MNVGSIKTSQMWRNTDDSIICLQETRVRRNNHRTCSQEVAAMCSMELSFRGSSELTATLLPLMVAPPFWPPRQPLDLSPKLTMRLTNMTPCSRPPECVRVGPRLHPTFECSFSLSMPAREPPPIKSCLIKMRPSSRNLFTVWRYSHSHCRRFPNLSLQLSLGGRWFDPLQTIDSEGNLFRPLTYSFEGSFAGAGNGCSSIDAILMNHVAFAALRTIDVVDTGGTQHRPIHASFSWERIFVQGDIHLKTASLDTTALPPWDIRRMPFSLMTLLLACVHPL